MTNLETSLGGMPLSLKRRYGNYVAGEWMPPLSNSYFENTTPITGKVLCEIPRSNAADIDRALDAAHAARREWGKTPVARRARILEQIAERMGNAEQAEQIPIYASHSAVPEARFWLTPTATE